MAPEVITGDGYDFSADWWSVGILMFQMKFGFTPFQSRNRAANQENIINAEVVWPNKARFPRSEQFDDLVMKLLVKDRTERLATHEDVLAHEWFPREDEIQAYEAQSASLNPPIIPPVRAADEEETYEFFDIKQGKNVLNETILNAQQKQMIVDENDLFIQFETTPTTI